jgi:hypothetical protein
VSKDIVFEVEDKKLKVSTKGSFKLLWVIWFMLMN